MMLIEVDEITKSFGAHAVLEGISFGVPKGSFTVLVGPSGCGKSTLLRLIAGLDCATSGAISIKGRVVNNVAPKDRDIAMVFQNYALYPHKTVAQNMGFSLAMRGTSRAEIDRAVKEAAAILGLSDLLDRKPAALTGGQRQRVAMGRAIVRQPVAFLFDEPLSNLDAQLRAKMRSEVSALHRRLGATSIYVTHDQIEAMTMADQIVVLRAGRIEQAGSPVELYDRPANTFVAEFIGNPGMNLLKARVAEDRRGLLLDGGQSLRLEFPIAAAASSAVTVGIRPEHIGASDIGDEKNALDLVVETAEFTGAEQAVTGTVGGQRMSVMLRDRLVLAPGDRLAVAVVPGAIHLFDATGSGRLAGC